MTMARGAVTAKWQLRSFCAWRLILIGFPLFDMLSRGAWLLSHSSGGTLPTPALRRHRQT
jgi:hypothetical protein